MLDQPCADPFIVTVPSGSQFRPAPRPCDPALRTPTRVAPGATLVLTRLWRGDVGTSWASPTAGAAPEPLAPGTYVLIGAVPWTGSEVLAGRAPVTIQVRP